MNTSNYVYNKTIEEIKKGHNPLDFEGLRNKIITLDTKTGDNKYNLAIKLLSQLNKTKEKFVKKNEEDLIKLKFINSFIDGLKNLKIKTSKKKNINIKDWELNTPKDTRAGSVDDVCKAYKTGFANLKAGNIKYFNLDYRRKNKVNKSCVVAKNAIKINNGIITISPQSFKEKKCNGNFNIGKKTRNTKKHKDLKIKNDCRIIMQKGEYWVIIPIPYEVEEKKKPVNYCGIDPGVRTFMTCFGNDGYTEFEHDNNYIKKLDNKIHNLQTFFKLSGSIAKKVRLRKKKLNKLEKRKENIINELHWNTINKILKNYDFIFYGDIKSHDVVKDGKNKTLNTDMMNLKLYKFKQRLLFKAEEKNKKVFEVKEHYTTKTCSFCGSLNNPEKSKIYECKSCNIKIGRDINASKNILMKGIKTCL